MINYIEGSGPIGGGDHVNFRLIYMIYVDNEPKNSNWKQQPLMVQKPVDLIIEMKQDTIYSLCWRQHNRQEIAL